MSAKKKPVSLADKINSLVTAVPTAFGSDDEAEETKAKVVDYDDEIDNLEDFKNEFNSSSIRRKNVGLLEEVDKRYSGKKVSKKEIFNNESSDESDEEEEDGAEESEEENSNIDSEDDDASLNGAAKDSDEEGSNNDESAEDDDDNDDDDDEEDDDMENEFGDCSVDASNPLRRDRTATNGIKTMSAVNVRAEIEKGNCVREQLKLWENLLEMRIKLQKCVVSSNKMPQHDVHKDYQSNDEYKTNCKKATNQLSGLLNNLLELQSNLLNNFPETKGLLTKSNKRKASDDDGSNEEDNTDEEIPSDTEDEMNDSEEQDEEESKKSDSNEKKGPAKKKMKLSEYENVLAKNHDLYTDYRNSVIQKWNDKTRIASGVVSKGINQPAVKQIEFALANKDKLLKKTQLKRSEYEIIGKSSTSEENIDGRRTQEYDTEIYDDDDFYHQLLRELIEYKSADITDPIQLSKQWIQLQNMRSKMKRKIDTRATKGRRIRYTVHQKLVNFMAPIAVFDTWTDHAKDELYSSLFGKIKPANNQTGEETKSTS